MRLQRRFAGFYTDGAYYVMATERCGADGRTPLKSRRWWSAGRIVNGECDAADGHYGTKREAVDQARRLWKADIAGARTDDRTGGAS